MDKQKIFDFIKTQDHAVVCSVTTDGQPHSALVAITETEDQKLFFGSDKDTRKVTNLSVNPKMSLVVGHGPISVQLTGTGEVVDNKEFEQHKKIHLKKHPTSAAYADSPTQVYVKFTPEWARYTDLGKSPEEIFEVMF